MVTCDQQLDFEGGAFGCKLPAGHAGPHQIQTLGARRAQKRPLFPEPAGPAGPSAAPTQAASGGGGDGGGGGGGGGGFGVAAQVVALPSRRTSTKPQRFEPAEHGPVGGHFSFIP